VKSYLIDSPDKTFDKKSVRAYKSLRAWSLSLDDHVFMLELNAGSTSDSFVFVRAYCKPSQSTTHVYPVHVCLDGCSGTVYGAECRCVAGRGECCSHVAAVLFKLDDFISQGLQTVPDANACTDTSCSWIAPANAAKVAAEPLEKVHVYKPSLGKPKPVEPALTLEKFHPVPVSFIEAATSRAGGLCAALREACPTAPFVRMYDAQRYCGATNTSTVCPANVPTEAPHTIGFCDFAPSRELQLESSTTSKAHFDSPSTASTAAFLVLRNLVDTSMAEDEAITAFVDEFNIGGSETVAEIEQDTRGQSLNNMWFYHRVGRITSSMSHRVAHMRASTSPTSILDQVLGCTKRDSMHPEEVHRA